jgi:hypothetical protein
LWNTLYNADDFCNLILEWMKHFSKPFHRALHLTLRDWRVSYCMCREPRPDHCWTWSCCLMAFSRTICTLMHLCGTGWRKVPSSKVAPSNLAPSNVFSLGTFTKLLQAMYFHWEHSWSYLKQCIFIGNIHEDASSNVFHWEQFMSQCFIIGNTFVYKAVCLNAINSLNWTTKCFTELSLKTWYLFSRMLNVQADQY